LLTWSATATTAAIPKPRMDALAIMMPQPPGC
jgi:hypothetical protein